MTTKNEIGDASDIISSTPVAKNEPRSEAERVNANLAKSIADMAVTVGLHIETEPSAEQLVSARIATSKEILRLRDEVEEYLDRLELDRFDSENFMTDLMALADKRDAYCKKQPPCPKCAAMQVQLVSWDACAKWKCRHCKTTWETP